jgi:disulfide bond formation protein DsbB
MHDEITTAAKITPAAAGAAWSWFGLTLNEWVAAATLLYIVAQIGLLVPKYWAAFFRKDPRK